MKKSDNLTNDSPACPFHVAVRDIDPIIRMHLVQCECGGSNPSYHIFHGLSESMELTPIELGVISRCGDALCAKIARYDGAKKFPGHLPNIDT